MQQIPNAYRQQIIKVLEARGVPVTEENIRKVATAQKPQPKVPSRAEQILTGVGTAVAAGAGAGLGPKLGESVASSLGLGTASAAPAVASAATPAVASAATPAVASAAPMSIGAGSLGLAGASGTGGAGMTVPGSLGLAGGSGAGGAGASASMLGTLTTAAPYLLPAIGVGVLGALYGDKLFGSSKDTHQKARDYARDRMEGLGLYEHTPATKEKFSMGGDGGYRLPDDRRSFEIVKGMAEGRPEREFTAAEGEAIGRLNPLGYIVAQGRNRGDVDLAGNAVGLLYNELANRGEEGVTNAEIADLYSRAGLDQGTAFEAINELAAQERISLDEQRAAQNALNQIFGSEYYSTDDDAIRQQARRLLGL